VLIGTPVITTRRIKDLVAGSLPIAGLVLLLNLAAMAITGQAPDFLRRMEVVNPDELTRIAAKIASVEAVGEDAENLAIVVGFSTAREGIDAARVGEGVDHRLRVLNLGSSGGSFRELNAYFDSLFGSRLRPRLLILAVHPAWLAGRVLQAPTVPSPQEVLNIASRTGFWSGESRNAAQTLITRWFWPVENQGRFNTVLRSELLLLKIRLGQAFNLSAHELFKSSVEDPWKARILYTADRASHEFLARQMEHWEAFGWFDADRYSASGREAIELAALLRKARGASVQAVVVLMPERSDLRGRVPPDAARSLHQIVAKTGGSVPVIDLREALPDEFFHDHAHPNKAGRACLSTIVAGQASRILQYPGAEQPTKCEGG
jgi:hypothetical protein